MIKKQVEESLVYIEVFSSNLNLFKQTDNIIVLASLILSDTKVYAS